MANVPQKPPTEEEHRAHIIKRVEILKQAAWDKTLTGDQAFEYFARCQDFFRQHGAKLVELLTKKESTDAKGKTEGGTATQA